MGYPRTQSRPPQNGTKEAEVPTAGIPWVWAALWDAAGRSQNVGGPGSDQTAHPEDSADGRSTTTWNYQADIAILIVGSCWGVTASLKSLRSDPLSISNRDSRRHAFHDCTIALAAGFIPGTWATGTNERGAKRVKYRKGSKDRTNSGPKAAQKVVEGEGADDRYDGPLRHWATTAQAVGLAPTPRPTKSSPPAVSNPKITEGPTLVRRKLGAMQRDVIHDGFLGKRGAADLCPTSYSLCPSSVGGDCCPNDYVCGTSSCTPNTATPATACGFSGYIACPIADGGGCCPSNYVCAASSCSPRPGASTSTCSANYFACPASLGGGCCSNGMGCKLNGCYFTTPVVFTLTDTITTTDASSNTVTLTSTITSTTVSGAPNPTDTLSSNPIVAQIPASATPVAKTQATSASTGGGGGGLSTAALGGIIGGAIFFLSAILIAAIFIIRGLNRATKAQEMANSRGSYSAPRSGRGSAQHRPSQPQDVDALSVDPLMITGSSVSGSMRRTSGQSPPITLPEMEGSNSPPVFLSPFSPRSPPHTHYPKGYNPVASSESQYSQSSGGYRNPSLDSSPPLGQNSNNVDYFNYPRNNQNNNNRVSLVSSQGRRPSHGRNYSNSSDVSQTSSRAAELDAGRDGSRKNSLQVDEGERRSSLQRFMTRIIRRRQSDPPVLTGGPVRGGDWTPSPREGLGHIAEAGESKIHVDHDARGNPILGHNRNQDPEPQTPFQDISLMDQPPGFRSN
ncbi:uncharacterized protein PAC_06760 [Phialocephala subalpina]|uniref:Uncharacterized protein n=1 Tax=Phialocephala subalpina TaxID=576137 RepID=A0A1L7WVS8_9HELO|nr:uncharacterized protein PAC_06760 [Phialocephala subalpina]